MNNAELIDGLQNRDPAAARYLYECLVPVVWRFVFYRVDRNSHLTEDVVAATVLALIAAADAGTTIDSPLAWLRTVALRRVQDHYRAVARVQHLLDKCQPPAAGTDQQDPAVQYEQALDRQQVRDALLTLPEHYQLALEWKYVEQLSVAVIAARMKVTEKSVEALLFRARRALKCQLESAQVPPSATARPGVAEAKNSETKNSEAKGAADGKPRSSRDSPAEAAVDEKKSLIVSLRLAQEP